MFAAEVCKMLEVQKVQELVTLKTNLSTGFSTEPVEKLSDRCRQKSAENDGKINK
jgi:hypothetical protein